MNEHLKRLIEAADRADAGETHDITDLTDVEYSDRLMESVRMFEAGEKFERELVRSTREERLAELYQEFETVYGWSKGDEGGRSFIEWLARHKMNLRGRSEARRYIIARDFNEFRPDKADILWKLQKQ